MSLSKNRLWTGLACGAATLAVALFLFCTKDNPSSSSQDNTKFWTYEGTVLDGYTGKGFPKGSIKITHINQSGVACWTNVDTNSKFKIDEIPAGARTVTFTVLTAGLDSTIYARSYTSVVKVPHSLIDSTTNKLNNVSEIIKMYPLNGAVSGDVKMMRHSRAPRIVARDIQLKLTYDPVQAPDMPFSTPQVFDIKTDSSGKFSVAGLPVAPGARIEVIKFTQGAIDWEYAPTTHDVFVNVKLGANQVVPVGTLIMQPVNRALFKRLTTSYPDNAVKYNEVFTLTYSEVVDSQYSYATLTMDENSVPIQVAYSFNAVNKTFTVTPAQSLVNAKTYTIRVYAFGLNGGEVLEDKATVTAYGGGMTEIVSSNVLDKNFKPINGLGLNVPMKIKFNKNISTANVSVKKGSTIVVVDVVYKGDSLVISPKGGKWESTTYTVAVTAELADKTPIDFSFQIETEGVFDFVKKNFDSGAIGFLDDIILIANKPIASAEAILSGKISREVIPVTTTINGDTLTIAPAYNLLPGENYTLAVTGTTTKGEVFNKNYNFNTISNTFYPLYSNLWYNNDQTKLVMDFALNGQIRIVMSDSVKSATASLRENNVNGVQKDIALTIKSDTILIVPDLILKGSTSYYLVCYATGVNNYKKEIIFNTFKTENALTVVKNNFDANNLGFADNIVLVANKTVASAQVVLEGDITRDVIPVTTTLKGDTVTINPLYNLLPGNNYALNVILRTAIGELYNYSTSFTTVSSTFYTVYSNLWNNNDPASLVNNFALNGRFVIVMSDSVKAATASLAEGSSSGAQKDVTVSIKKDTVTVTPTQLLKGNTSYYLACYVTSTKNLKKDVVFNTFRTASDFYAVSSNIRYDNDPNKPVLDFPVDGTIQIVMSDSVAEATVQFDNLNDFKVTISGKTVNIKPTNLTPGTAYTLTVRITSTKGYVLSGVFVNNFYVKSNVFFTASNVLDDQLVGLDNIAINVQPYFVISKTPNAATIKAVLTGGPEVVVTVSGDTVKLKPVTQLNFNTGYTVTITGMTTEGYTINLTSATFTTVKTGFIVATNMWDAQGNPATNLPRTVELWVKFSKSLAAVTEQTLNGGTGTTVIYGTGLNANATVRVSGDTLFAKFLAGQLPAFGATVSLRSEKILFTDGTFLGAGDVNLTSTIVSASTPYVLSTNGKANGAVVDTFGTKSTVWIVSSMPFTSVDAITAVTGAPGANNLVLTNVSTNGDTIFFTPSFALGYATEYAVKYYVTLTDGSPYTGANLEARWKTQKALYIVSANDMNTAQNAYRPYAVYGDSLKFTFSRAIDVTRPFSVASFITNYSYVWSNGNKTLCILPTDTLAAKTYSENPDYAVGAAAEYSPTLSLYAADGEQWTTKALTSAGALDNKRPDFKVHTVVGIEVLNTNLKRDAITGGAFVNTYNQKMATLITNSKVSQNDTFRVNGAITVEFSRAVDSSLIKTNPETYIKLMNSANTIIYDVTLGFSNSGKTVTITPNQNLTYGTIYTLNLVTVPALGLKHSGTGVVSYMNGAGGSYEEFTFTTVTTGKKVTSKVPVLAKDTASAANVLDKRIGYSPSNATGGTHKYKNGGMNPTDVSARNQVKLMWYEVEWTSPTDTVSHYQYAVKGRDGGWYELRTYLAAGHFNPFNPNLDSLVKPTLDLSAAITDIYNVDVSGNVRTPDADGGSGVYVNGSDLFNYGQVLQVKIRPVVSSDAIYDAADQLGSWSNVISFSDNIAPCDSDFVAYSTNLASIATPAAGGVSAGVVVGGGGTVDRTGGNNSATTVTFTFTFPEDMVVDNTNKPSVSIFYGITASIPATKLTLNTAQSYWTNGYTYQMVFDVPAGTNWKTAHNAYYVVNIAGVKDGSQNAIYQWGSLGTAADGVLNTAVTGNTVGTVNLLNIVTLP